MMIRAFVICSICLAIAQSNLPANTLTPDNVGAPFGVQAFAGLGVTGGVTDSFFSDLSGLAFPGPSIITILAGLTAFDDSFNPIGTFSITGVTVTQGASTFSPDVDPFSLSLPVTYTSTLDPLSQVTVNPGDYNVAFVFDSDASFQYSYALNVSGIPDGGFLLYNDVEGALIPEPDLRILLLLALGGVFGWKQRVGSAKGNRTLI
jgi:hypothetical protein